MQNKDYQAISKVAEETNNQIIALQAKTEDERSRFDNEIQKLQLRLKEPDPAVETDDKNYEKA